MKLIDIQNEDNILKTFIKGFDLYNNILEQGKILTIKNKGVILNNTFGGDSKKSCLINHKIHKRSFINYKRYTCCSPIGLHKKNSIILFKSFCSKSTKKYTGTLFFKKTELYKIVPTHFHKVISSFEIFNLSLLFDVLKKSQNQSLNSYISDSIVDLNKIILKNQSGCEGPIYVNKNYGFNKTKLNKFLEIEELKGRLYPEDSLSLVHFKSEVRNILTEPYYEKFGIVNSLPGLLCFYAKTHSLPYLNLLYFYNHKDEVINSQTFVSKEEFEAFIKAILHGGNDFSFMLFIQKNDSKLYELLSRLIVEIGVIRIDISTQVLKQSFKDVPKTEVEKIMKSNYSIFFFTYESTILLKVYNKFVNHQSSFVPMYDKFYIQKGFVSADFLNNLNTFFDKEYCGFVKFISIPIKSS